jgi:predicted GIY-YIG superfamily endonuclease
MMAETVGRSLELFFIDGKPDGMQTAEVFNWTGHVLLTPRTRIKAALDRKEAGYTGVYVLLGEKNGAPFAYIGEAEDIGQRIRSHDQGKDWWTQAALVTTGANALNKAHVKYLESRLVEIARAVKRRDLENANTPPRPGLSESARANMEAFLDYLLMVFPALRIDMFQEYAKLDDTPLPSLAAAASSGPAGPRFTLTHRKTGLTATAVLDGDEFTVLKGSAARLRWEGREVRESGYAQRHEDLRKKGVLVDDGDHCTFAKSYAFTSPSAAAAVVTGRQANGTMEWKVEGTSQTYKAWEAEQLASGGD